MPICAECREPALHEDDLQLCSDCRHMICLNCMDTINHGWWPAVPPSNAFQERRDHEDAIAKATALLKAEGFVVLHGWSGHEEENE